jgi:hypothetical protein
MAEVGDIPVDAEHHYGIDEERFQALQAALDVGRANGRFRWEATPHGLSMPTAADAEHAPIVAGLTRLLGPLFPGLLLVNALEFAVGGGYGRTPADRSS